MKIHLLENRSNTGYITFGSVWSRGEVITDKFLLINNNGENIPIQSRVTAWWPDGSVKWAAHTADAAQIKGEAEILPINLHENIYYPNVGKEGHKYISLKQEEGCYLIQTGKLTMRIPYQQEQQTALAEQICYEAEAGGNCAVSKIEPVLMLEHPIETNNSYTTMSECVEYKPLITDVELEERGILQSVFCFRGSFYRPDNEVRKMHFTIRMYLWADSEEIKLVHTFFYDGDEQHDFLKGMGIRFVTLLSGKEYNHHVQFITDSAPFHEAAILLNCNHPRLDKSYLVEQLEGVCKSYTPDSIVEQAAADLPIWDRYWLMQDSAEHYKIQKQTDRNCCAITCQQGNRATGVMAVNGSTGGILLGIRDFWEKYPSGLEVTGLGSEEAQCTVWFHAPQAECYDFRHYATKSYPMSSYEGFNYVGADPNGIAVTSECRVAFTKTVPEQERLEEFMLKIRKPPVCVGTPEYYYEKKAFGDWSLPRTDTKEARWYEEQLEKAFAFYQQEVEARDWYGLFDYGDIMHTYDSVRHCWRYDMGGFAWQNTELVPTYWLWLYFLRTGREDVYTMAEAMSRHCSEVDIYHFGQMKGLGSRHNVRHWGCSCKEPRIAMAGHHRFLYYLTGDYRIGEVMDEVKDADWAIKSQKGFEAVQEDGSRRIGARSGPDWSSFVSNWMTFYERTLNRCYRERIETGIQDIAATPFGFASGPDYWYDIEMAHLIYHGESETTPNQHLQICMGGPQIWLETGDMLEDSRLKEMLVKLGAFYLLDKEEKARLTNGKIKERPFSWPMFAAGIVALAAKERQDKELAKKAWRLLKDTLNEYSGAKGFDRESYAQKEDKTMLYEIPWISTNTVSQWCLNVIMCMEYIGDLL